jgi:hypothetical protein
VSRSAFSIRAASRIDWAAAEKMVGTWKTA